MRSSRSSRFRAIVLIAVHLLIGIHVVQWLMSGTTVSPVEPSEAGYLLDAGKLNTGFILFVVLILGTLVFGRWFCGWACHVVALQDLSAWLLGKFGMRPRPVRSRLLVLLPFAVAFHMFFQGQVERFFYGVANKPIETAFFTTDLWERFPGPIMGFLTFLVVGFLIVWWLGGKGFCTYGCPYGAVFSVADRFAPGRIRVTDACDSCGHCTSVCTSNVRVHEEVAIHKQIVDPACMKCMDCVSVCPKEALYFGFTTPKPFAISQQKIKSRADFTWPEEIALAVVACASTVAFRGAWFFEHVPFLMAVGLGVITAVFALLGWRILVQRDVSFQHTRMKQDGVRLSAGTWSLVFVLAWLLLVIDTGVVRYHSAAANVMALSIASFNEPAKRKADLQAMDARLLRAQSWSLFVDPEIHRKRGLALRDLAMLNSDKNLMLEAEAQLSAALLQRPSDPSVLVPLADVLHVLLRDDEAFLLLQRAKVAAPNNEEVLQRLQSFQSGGRK